MTNAMRVCIAWLKKGNVVKDMIYQINACNNEI